MTNGLTHKLATSGPSGAAVTTSSRLYMYLHTSIHPYFHTCTCTLICASILPYHHSSILQYIHTSIHPFPFQMKPIVTELEYLEQQHLLILLKSQEGDESYGEHLCPVLGLDSCPVMKCMACFRIG